MCLYFAGFFTHEMVTLGSSCCLCKHVNNGRRVVYSVDNCTPVILTMYNAAVRVNSKATIAMLISLIVCVYITYSWTTARSSMKSGTHHRRLDTWKKHDFVDIPDSIQELTRNIKVNEDTVKVVLDDQVIGNQTVT